MARTFTDTAAKRERVPLLVGLFGASGGGKTFSALRLATGMQRVTGGEIFGIDSESRRMLHYADRFSFRHVQFDPEFSPMDYLAAIEYCKAKGASIVIVDSMSHEHEGPGGVLEWHDREAERLAKAWKVSVDKANIPAWGAPKAARRRVINTILQLGINAIFCFRAKEKLKIVTGKQPIDLGWMPIAGEEYLYEMTVNCMLPPACGGVPEWKPQEIGTKTMLKCPVQFADIFATSQPLSEEIGEALARWAAGDQAPRSADSDKKVGPDEEIPESEDPVTVEKVCAEIRKAGDRVSLANTAQRYRSMNWSDEERQAIKDAVDRRDSQLKEQA